MNEENKLKFKKLFGIEAEKLGASIILSPFLSPKVLMCGLKKTEFFKGLVYRGVNGIYQGSKISCITTGMGHPLVVDCIAALDAQRVKSVIFLGAIGAVEKLEYADCAVIESAYFDSGYYRKFCIFDIDPAKETVFRPDAFLLKQAEESAKRQKINLKKTNVISLNSLWEQNQEMVLELKRRQIQSVDLECALFYASAKIKGLKTVALCFVSDLLFSRPYWQESSLAEKMRIKNNGAQLLKLAFDLSVTV